MFIKLTKHLPIQGGLLDFEDSFMGRFDTGKGKNSWGGGVDTRNRPDIRLNPVPAGYPASISGSGPVSKKFAGFFF